MQKAFIAIFILCFPLFSDKGESSSSEAIVFVKNMVTEALAIVNSDSMQDDAKRQKLSECINNYLDIERITQAVFGPLGYNDLSDDDKTTVQAYFKKYLLRFYAGEGKLSAMVNAKLVGKPPAEAKEKDFSVTTKFSKGGSAKPTEIVWVTDANKVYYVIIEGVNQIITLRAEMKAQVDDKPLMEYINAVLK